jgi:hypothetical protein
MCHGFFRVIEHGFNDDAPGNQFSIPPFSSDGIEFIFL